MTDARDDSTPTFTTAARRRGGGLISFNVDGIEIGDDGETIEDITVTLKVDPALDIARFTAVFTGLVNMLAKMPKRSDLTGGADDLTPEFAATMDELAAALPRSLDSLRSCLIPGCRGDFDRVRESIDVMTLSAIISMITQKLSPVDPTERPSSSGGSAGTGTASPRSARTKASTSRRSR